MDNGRLAVPQADADVTIADGQIRLANTTVNAQDGAKLSLAGMLDLNSLAIDAHMTLSAQPAANALITTRPEFAVSVKGQLAAPERQLDVSTLVGWLTLRATELQTRRLESIEANRREEVVGPVVRPASPAVRFIPMGTALETRDHINACRERRSGRVPSIACTPRVRRHADGCCVTAVGISRQQPGADNTAATGRRRVSADAPRRHHPRFTRRSICYSAHRIDAIGGAKMISRRRARCLAIVVRPPLIVVEHEQPDGGGQIAVLTLGIDRADEIGQG